MVKEEYVLGFDISTRTIGITVMDLKGKLVSLDFISLPKNIRNKKIQIDVTLYDKVDSFDLVMKKYSDFNIKHIFIEEPLKNGPSIHTTILLAIFNGMISHELYKIFKIQPQHFSVHTARSYFFPEYITSKLIKGVIKETLSFPKNVDKKKLVFDKVCWYEPHFIPQYSKNFILKEENFDMADSYCVAKAGLINNNYISSI